MPERITRSFFVRAPGLEDKERFMASCNKHNSSGLCLEEMFFAGVEADFAPLSLACFVLELVWIDVAFFEGEAPDEAERLLQAVRGVCKHKRKKMIPTIARECRCLINAPLSPDVLVEV